MSSIETLPGITSSIVATKRLKVHVLQAGPADGEVVVFLHGNASSATFWEEQLLALPKTYRGLAIDLRGYGDTEDLVIDATRGLQDWADDVLAVLEALNVKRFHVVGHSLGGMLLYTLAPSAAAGSVLSLTLVAPGSPYGFGGTKDVDGTPCWSDFAGAGGGLVNPEFARLLGEKNRGSDNPQASPRVVMNSFYWKPPFVAAREEALLSSLLSEKVGGDRYPGDAVPSTNWPNVSPGVFGPLNAASPKYIGDTLERFLAMSNKPRVLWVRGADDQIVGDMSLFDMGTLGKLGAVPGWPGDDVFPPQPMVGQTRRFLERYTTGGGAFVETVYADCGHTPYIEHAQRFAADLAATSTHEGRPDSPLCAHSITLVDGVHQGESPACQRREHRSVGARSSG